MQFSFVSIEPYGFGKALHDTSVELFLCVRVYQSLLLQEH